MKLAFYHKGKEEKGIKIVLDDDDIMAINKKAVRILNDIASASDEAAAGQRILDYSNGDNNLARLYGRMLTRLISEDDMLELGGIIACRHLQTWMREDTTTEEEKKIIPDEPPEGSMFCRP